MAGKINVRVSNQLWRPGVPAGGTTEQWLKKSSSVDYATEWADLSDAADSMNLGTSDTAQFGGLEVTGSAVITGVLEVGGYLYIVKAPPANASSPGHIGTITFDFDYLYVCVATNTWKRVALSTW